MNLAGRVALVTGGARRVGRAIALRLARAGCRIGLHYGRSEADARRTAAECAALGVDVAVFSADLADADAASALPPRVRAHFGELDILINNASTFEPMRLEDFELARWETTLRVNLTAPLLLTLAAREALQQAGGRVINLCDIATERPWADHLAYCVSKGGLETLTRLLAKALAPRVNVVGIAPGVAEFPESYDAAQRARLTQKIPLGRAGTPEDVAALVHFLLNEGDFITGAILPVDGGRRLV